MYKNRGVFLVVLVVSWLLIAAAIVWFLLWQNNHERHESDTAGHYRLHKIFSELDSTFWKDQEASLLLVDEALKISGQIHDSSAYARSLYNRAKVNWKFEHTDSVLADTKQALDIAERMKNDTLTGMIKNLVGNYYLDRNNHYMAFLYYKETLRLAEKFQDQKLIASTNNGLGILYIASNDLDKALKHLAISNRIFHSLGNKLNEAIGLMNMGISHFAIEDHNVGIAYMKMALRMSRELENKELECKVLANLGIFYKYLEQDEAALGYFHRALSISEKYNYLRLQAYVLQQMGAFFAETNELGKAGKLLERSRLISTEIGFKTNELKVMTELSNLKQKEGQWKNALKYQAMYSRVSDSISNLESNNRIEDYRREMDSQKRKYEIDMMISTLKVQKGRNLIFIISAVSVLIIMLIFAINLKRSIRLTRIENVLLKKKMMDTFEANELEKHRFLAEIETQNEELTNLSLQVITKNEMLTDISETTSKLYKAQSMDLHSFNDLKKIIKESLNVDKDWEQFKRMFEKANQDFFVNIKAVCPELSEHELRMCAYLKINLSNAEISRILNISPGTIKTNRYRIRKKLNLETSVVLEDYIRTI